MQELMAPTADNKDWINYQQSPSRFFWMRSAGFPFEWLDELKALSDSPLFQRYEQLIDDVLSIESEAAQIVRHNVPKALPKLLRKFKEGLPVHTAEMPASLREACDPLLVRRVRDIEEIADILKQLMPVFKMQQNENRQRLGTYLQNEELREAVFLSNPESLQRMDSLVSQLTAENEVILDSRNRQRFRLAWNYLQRLCAKNDTSSFFGPITWGTFSDDINTSLSVCRPDGKWLSSRQTFFEYWVILRLSRAIIRDEGLRWHIPLKMNAGCYVVDGTLHYPLGKTIALNPLSQDFLHVLGVIGSDLTAKPRNWMEVRAHLAAAGRDDGPFFDLLKYFLDKNILDFHFEVPLGSRQAMTVLRKQLDRLNADDLAKCHWLNIIDQLEEARQTFAQGDLNTRRQALGNMSQVLTSVNIDTNRDQGKMYVGRFPVYEDCSRNLEVTIGGELAKNIQETMQPVITLYRWLAGSVAVLLHEAYLTQWQVMVDGQGVGAEQRVDFLKFLTSCDVNQNHEAVTLKIRTMIQTAWAKIIPNHADNSNDVVLNQASFSELIGLLDTQEPRAFHFPGLSLNIHSPDFMLAAESEAAIMMGEYQVIIGEVHPAVHTVSQPVAQPFCPHEDDIRTEVEQLIQTNTAIIADSPETYQRSHIDWPDVPNLMQIVLPKGIGRLSPERCLPAGSGCIIKKEGVLYYKDLLTGLTQDLLTAIPSDMHRACFALAADLLGSNIHSRVIFNRLVVKRKSWHICGTDLPVWGQPAEDLRAYAQCRQWARQLNMPRHVFVKIAGEPKPIYVDFDNPLSLDLLAHLCKNATDIFISEMRPAPNELWFWDKRGRYCSEFRTSFTLTPSLLS